jgi:hypothetical protein
MQFVPINLYVTVDIVNLLQATHLKPEKPVATA